MILQIEVAGYIFENAYVYADDATRHGFLIDPGAEPERILHIIADRKITVEKILLTHGHFDHIGAVAEIQRALKIPAYMHENGGAYVKNPAWNGSTMVGDKIVLDGVNFLKDGAVIALENNPAFALKLIATPGHTTDGAIYYSERDGAAFVGDTIFRGSFGRTDLAGGDFGTLMNSIRTKILTLPEETILYSGHSEPTTVGAEKKFFRE